jgi:hypothetical protein
VAQGRARQADSAAKAGFDGGVVAGMKGATWGDMNANLKIDDEILARFPEDVVFDDLRGKTVAVTIVAFDADGTIEVREAAHTDRSTLYIERDWIV